MNYPTCFPMPPLFTNVLESLLLLANFVKVYPPLKWGRGWNYEKAKSEGDFIGLTNSTVRESHCEGDEVVKEDSLMLGSDHSKNFYIKFTDFFAPGFQPETLLKYIPIAVIFLCYFKP